jgi:DNA-directed RNA polymerase subunit beta'
VGYPETWLWNFLSRFLFDKLQRDNLVISINAAKKWVEQKNNPKLWKALQEVVRQHLVLLNRTPTLSRLGIQAFEPFLIEGKAIQLHPLVCQTFQVHFDGDQLAVHIPLSIEAQQESQLLMISGHHIHSQMNGEPLIVPSQEMVLGLYLMTRESDDSSTERRVFANIQEAERAYESGVVELSDYCQVRLQTEEEQEELVETTVGRAIVSQCLPKEVSFGFINRSLTSQAISQLIHYCYRQIGTQRTISFIEKLSSLGFSYATRAGVTLAIRDMVIPPQKSRLINEATLAAQKVQQQYLSGLITKSQRYNQMIDIWAKTHEQMKQAVADEFKGSVGAKRRLKLLTNTLPENLLYLMVEAGVQSLTPIFQLSGMRGLMKKSDGSILDWPITHNFRDGFSVHQYFISCHGARKGQADTVLRTANAGYLTRRLVDVAQDIIITESDCGTHDGLTFTTLTQQDGQVLELLADRLYGRVVAEDIFIPKRKAPIVKAGTLLDDYWVNFIEQKGVNQVKIRSPVTCQSESGVCAKCYGYDLASGQLITIGEAIGVIAAQSIGECASQLALGARRVGGVAEPKSVLDHIEVKYSGVIQFDNLTLIRRSASKSGKTMPQSLTSAPHFINVSHLAEIIELDSYGRKRQHHQVPYGAVVAVKDGDHVKAGQQIAYWDPYSYPIITEVSGYIHLIDVIEGITIDRETDENNGQVIYQVKDPKLWPLRAKDWLPRVQLVDKHNREIKLSGSNEPAIYVLPPYAMMTLEEGAKVTAGDIIAYIDLGISEDRDFINDLLRTADLFEARIPKEPAILARRSGTISIGKNTKTQHRFIITDEEGQTEQFPIPKWRQPSILDGQLVEVGEEIIEGEMNLQDILHLKGVNDLVEHMLKEIQKIYIHHGFSMNDKHVEVIIRQMLRTITIVEPGDSCFLSGEYVSYSKLLEENQNVIENSGQPATWEPNLLGITKASLATESFISAASFVDTTRVLLSSAVRGESDELRGLKENVIIGRLIPAGTGLSYHQNRHGLDVQDKS